MCSDIQGSLNSNTVCGKFVHNLISIEVLALFPHAIENDLWKESSWLFTDGMYLCIGLSPGLRKIDFSGFNLEVNVKVQLNAEQQLVKCSNKLLNLYS